MMTEKEFTEFRGSAREFFQGLEEHLSQHLPSPTDLEQVMARAAERREPWNKSHESAFLNSYVFRGVHEFISRNMSAKDALRAFLCEGYAHNRRIASGTPIRQRAHPFEKGLDATPSSILARWSKEGPGGLVANSCPDMALRAPFPYKTVFECKYFRERGIEAGESALVEGVHQTFFYLGLARLPERGKHPAWDYEFGCFLALDASNEGGLKKAWEKLSETVKTGIWDGANIHVMILRGSS